MNILSHNIRSATQISAITFRKQSATLTGIMARMTDHKDDITRDHTQEYEQDEYDRDDRDARDDREHAQDADPVDPIDDITHRMRSVIETPLRARLVSSDVPIPTYLMHDKIWGMIEISRVAYAVIQHPVFQRLKYIKQLGPLHFKFPYADHSRYEHSIGTANLARQAGQFLQRKHIEITARDILCLEIAALCHDLGHGCFSHSFDHLLYELKFTHITSHHEIRSQILVKYILEELRAKHVEHCGLTDAEIKLIQYFIDPERYQKYLRSDPSEPREYPTELPVFYHGLEQIVSNPIHKVDVDKMDYLMRDAQALRFDQTLNNTLDVIGMLKESMIVDSVWLFNVKHQGIVYDLICRRFLFYTNRYLHPEVNAISCMLTDALKAADKIMKFSLSAKLETTDDILTFCKLTDVYIIEAILNSNNPRLLDAQRLLTRILNGESLYKHIGDFVTSISDFDDSSYCQLPWNVMSDMSAPINLLPKVRYHQNGKTVDPATVKYVRRMYTKSRSRRDDR